LWRSSGFEHYPPAFWPSWLPALGVLHFFFGNFAEELFFRGYLLTRLERSLGWWKALSAQTLLFGLLHVNYNMFTPNPQAM